jgi:hypothetical protein
MCGPSEAPSALTEWPDNTEMSDSRHKDDLHVRSTLTQLNGRRVTYTIEDFDVQPMAHNAA